MPIGSCHGDTNKDQIVASYEISFVEGMRLFAGQHRDGCCGDLTDEYFMFAYKHRTDVTDHGNFFAGRHCASEFFTRLGIGHDQLRAFNPFTAVATGGGHAAAGGGGAPAGGHAGGIGAMEPLNIEIYNAIILIAMYRDTTPYNTFARILNYMRTHPMRRTDPWVVEAVNNWFDHNGMTMSGLLTALEALDTRPLKNFNFPEAHAVLTARGISSKFI